MKVVVNQTENMIFIFFLLKRNKPRCDRVLQKFVFIQSSSCLIEMKPDCVQASALWCMESSH